MMGDIDIRFYLSIFLRRLPYFLAIVVSVSIIGAAVAYLLPPVYRADAKILVETPQIPTDLARSTVLTGAVEQLQIIQQQITTRENLLALADKLDVYGPKRAELSESDIVDDMLSRTKFVQLQMDIASGSEGATVFSVSFDAREPVLAAAVVNELVTYILGRNVSLRTGRAGDTLQFFDQEVDRLGTDLTRLEGEILKFKNANKDALPDSQDFRRNQQSNQQERLLLLQREESGLRNRRNNLVQMFEATGRVAFAGPVTPEQQTLDELNRSLAEQLGLFSETSPNIAALRARIVSLQKGIQSKQASNSKAAGNPGPSGLDVQLADIDDRLRAIDQEKASITENLEELSKSLGATPGNETVLNALERNRANIQIQYNTAVARLAEASTGEQIELRAKGGRFSVVEPAIAPQSPVSPKRLHIAAGGMAGGIGLGLGVIVLLELLNKGIRRPIELTQLFETPPLATIPYILAEGEPRIKGLKIGLTVLLVFGAACSSNFAILKSHLPRGSNVSEFLQA